MSEAVNLNQPSPETRPSRHISYDMYEGLHPSFFDPTLQSEIGVASSGNQYEVIPTAHMFFRGMIQRIKQARSNVDLQFYTLEADQEVEQVMSAVAEAAERGVSVRARVDHLVSDPRRLFATIRQHREMNNLPNVSMRHMTTKRPDTTSFMRRDHRKIVAIDTETDHGSALIGGVNLAARSLRWNDFMVDIRGPLAADIQQDFEDSWNDRNGTAKRLLHDVDSETYLLTDTQSSEAIVQFAQEQIAQAEQRIWLETPYLDMPNMGTALIAAKRHNPALDVRVIIPRFNNYPVDRLRTRRMIEALNEAGIAAYAYGKTYRRLNHTKLLLIDDLVMFGSSNFNSGSFAGGNAEIEIATKDRSIVNQLERWYGEDIEESVGR